MWALICIIGTLSLPMTSQHPKPSSSLWGGEIFRGRRYRPTSESLPLQILSEGGKMALKQCQRQFEWERWNCSESVFERWNINGDNRLTKEMAFVDAIISAGVAYAVTANCSRGNSCRSKQKREEPQKEIFENERDFLRHGEKAVEKYLMKKVDTRDFRGIAHHHNYKVGSEVVTSTARKLCKCHGVSGTCTYKTCWFSVSSFEHISDTIYQRYKKAIRLDYDGGAGTLKLGNSARAGKILYDDKLIDKVAVEQLVYLEESPDYCKPNSVLGWFGTRGRKCWQSDAGNSKTKRENCRKLCRKCGHTVKKNKTEVIVPCNCRMSSNYVVNCESCKKKIVQNFCY